MPEADKITNYIPGDAARTLMGAVVEEYALAVGGKDGAGSHESLRSVAEEFGITPMKVRKLLITAGVYDSEISREVNRLYSKGRTIGEIQQELSLSRSSVHSYLPYTKAVYKTEESSMNAERLVKYRGRRTSIGLLQSALKEGGGDPDALLWGTLLLFQGYPFRTAKNLKYTYTVKGNEMYVSRKDKSLTRATVLLAFHNAVNLLKRGLPVDGPKKLGTFGASYLYPVFVRFGVIPGNGSGHDRQS